MDVSMPGISGFEAVRRMREIDPALRVVLVSLYDDPVYHDYAKRCGAVALVSKINVVTELPPLIEQVTSSLPEVAPGALKHAAPVRRRRSRNTKRSATADA